MEELIINSVYKREPLWNPSHVLHKNVGVLKKLWREVANEVKIDEKNVRTKWKNMRAYFFKELRKIQHPKSGDGADSIFISHWAFFEQLLFLKRTISASTRDSNFSSLNPISPPELLVAEESVPSVPSTSRDPLDTKENFDKQEHFTSSDHSTASLAGSYYSSTPSKKKEKNYNLLKQYHQILELEKKKIAILEKDSNRNEPNSDMLFFESLVPYMAHIPMIQKLRLRSKIQELILSELEIASRND